MNSSIVFHKRMVKNHEKKLNLKFKPDYFKDTSLQYWISFQTNMPINKGRTILSHIHIFEDVSFIWLYSQNKIELKNTIFYAILRKAIISNNISLVKLLMEKTTKPIDRYSIYDCIRNKSFGVFRVLLDFMSSVENDRIFNILIRERCIDEILYMIENKKRIVTDLSLILACESGCYDIVELFLKYVKPIRESLRVAIRQRRIKIIELLLNYNSVQLDESISHIVCVINCNKITKLLLKKGMNFSMDDIFIVTSSENIELLYLFMDNIKKNGELYSGKMISRVKENKVYQKERIKTLKKAFRKLDLSEVNIKEMLNIIDSYY